MRRREVIAGLAGAAVASLRSASAQQGERVRRIGVLMNLASDDPEAQAPGTNRLDTKARQQAMESGISPLDYMKAEEYADNNNLILLGVYHSHPEHPAIPSEHDLKVAMPYFSYVIVSVKKKKAVDFRSWRLSNGRFEEEKHRCANHRPQCTGNAFHH